MRHGVTANLGKTRVAVVSHGFLPLVGGAEAHHATVTNILAKASTVEVFTSSLCLDEHRPARRRGESRIVQLGDSEVRTTYLPSVRLLNEKYILPGHLMRSLLRFRPQVVWTNHPSASSFIAGVCARVIGASWIATYHADLDHGRAMRRAFMKAEAGLLRCADAVQVPTEGYLHTLARRGVDPGKIAVIPPVTRPDKLDGSLQHHGGVAAAIGLRPNGPILFVGGLDAPHEYKHPDDLIRALGIIHASGLIPHATFVGDGKRVKELAELARSQGVGAFVEFLGRVSDATLERLYREAMCLVVPSIGTSEGYGLVVLEALSFGCPVLASTDVPAALEFANGGGSLVYPAGDYRALASLLIQLLSSPTTRLSLAGQAASSPVVDRNDQHMWSLAKLIERLGQGQRLEGLKRGSARR